MHGAKSFHPDGMAGDSLWYMKNHTTLGADTHVDNLFIPNCHGVLINEIGMFCTAATGGVSGATLKLQHSPNSCDSVDMDHVSKGWVYVVDLSSPVHAVNSGFWRPDSAVSIGALNVKAVGEHFLWRPGANRPLIIPAQAHTVVDVKHKGVMLHMVSTEEDTGEQYTVDIWMRYRVLRGPDG